MVGRRDVDLDSDRRGGGGPAGRCDWQVVHASSHFLNTLFSSLRSCNCPPPGMRITRQQMTAEFNRKLLEDAYPSNLQMKREHVQMRRYVAIKY